MDFGNVGPGASAGVPFRFADLSQPSRKPPSQAGQGQASQAAGDTGRIRASVRSYLDGLKTTSRPVRIVRVVLPDGQAVLRVEFTAPSPLGLSGS